MDESQKGPLSASGGAAGTRSRHKGGGHAMPTVTVLPVGRTTVTLDQATDRFLRRDAFEPSTLLAYRRTLQILLDEFDGDRPVTAITSDDLDDLLIGRWGGAAATTFNRHRAALLSFFGWVQQRGWAPTNPGGRVRGPQGPPAHRRRTPGTTSHPGDARAVVAAA